MSERDQFEEHAKRRKLSLAYGECGYVYSSTNEAWEAWQASREALKAEQEYPDKLPCPVLLEPGMRFGKGVPTRSMLGALQRRAEYYAELELMTPEERAKQHEDLRNFLNIKTNPIDTTSQQYETLAKGE